MHHTLRLYEVLLHIFGHCLPPKSYWTPSRKVYTSDLAALARTCRTFKEPALDVLWSELVDLTPLVRCLPEACQFINTRYSFKRPPTEREWDVLCSYTRRTWNISGYSNPDGYLDNANLISMTRSITTPLFPNLRSFYWQGLDLMPVFHISAPWLNTLDLHFTHGNRLADLPDFLGSVGVHCPHMKQFRIHVFHVQLLQESIMEHVRRWRHLQVFDFHGIIVTPEMISRLADMPSLSYLAFTLIPGVTDWIPHSGFPSVFPKLVQLEATCEYLRPVIGLLSCTRLPVLGSLMVVCLARPSKNTFRSFLTTFQAACSPESFSQFVFFNSSSPRLHVWNLLPSGAFRESDELRLTMDDLRPCMAFVNLSQIRIDVKWSVALDDEDVLTLASAWPNLTFLYINERWGWRAGGKGMTPRGLVRLLRMHPKLTMLAVAIQTPSFAGWEAEWHDEQWVGYSPGEPIPVNIVDSRVDAEDVLVMIDALVALSKYFYFYSAWDGLDIGASQAVAGCKWAWESVFDGVNQRLLSHEVLWRQ